MNEYDDENRGAYAPTNNLDLNWRTIETAWGDSSQMPKYFNSLFDKFTPLKDVKGNFQTNEKGEVLCNKSNMWEMLKFFTRDFRLSNLGYKDLVFCEYYTNIASDYLSLGFVKCFFTALTRVVGRLELCQSKGGFFRKQNNTLINVRQNMDGVTRKGLFSKKNMED